MQHARDGEGKMVHLGGGVSVPSYMLKHDEPPLFCGFELCTTGASEERGRYTTSLHEFLNGAEIWLSRRGFDPADETRHPACKELMVTLFRGECQLWYKTLAHWERNHSYVQLKGKLIARYVPREEIERLKAVVSRMKWDGRSSMRDHCTKFQVAMQKLVVYAHISQDQAWEWFRDSVKHQMHARMVMEMYRWFDTTPVFQDAVNTLCRIVDNTDSGSFGASASGGPTPMDISALSAQLQQTRLSRTEEDTLLAALGYADRGREGQRGSWGAGPSGGGRGGGDRGRTPDRWGGERSRTPDRQAGRSRTPDRRGGRGQGGPRIEVLRQHRLWPHRLRNMTQEQVDACTRKNVCFVCEKQQHPLGWTNCYDLHRGSPGRERGSSPNGGRPHSRGR